MLQITDVVKNLIIINVILFFGTTFLAPEFQEWFQLYSPKSELFKPVQLVTHMFMHADISHLLFNMLGVFFFGPKLEVLWGPKKFLFFYFACGFGAAAVHLAANYFEYTQMIASLDPSIVNEVLENGSDIWRRGRNYSAPAYGDLNMLLNVPVVGASGALYGILVGFGMKFPNAMMFPIPVTAKYFMAILLTIDILGGFTGFSIFGQNIAHFAHIGGAIFGFIMIMYWQKFGSYR